MVVTFVFHHGQGEAGIDPPPVHQHGTRAALAVIAALFAAGQVEMVAQRVEQGRPRREVEPRLGAVDNEHDRNFIRRRDGLPDRPCRRSFLRHLHSPHSLQKVRAPTRPFPLR
jgi:hypothetical protein